MDLDDEPGEELSLLDFRWMLTMAILMISAAVPWMGVFMAVRSPKLRTF